MGDGGGLQHLLVDHVPCRQDALVTVQTRQLQVEGVEGDGEAEADSLKEQSSHPRQGPSTNHSLSSLQPFNKIHL